MHILAILLSFALLAFTPDLSAEETVPGPAVGTPLPVAVELPNSQGEVKSLKDLAGEKGAVVVFFRSADWCPYCKRQLIDLNKIDQQVTDKGYQLVGVSYDSPEKLAKFKGKRGITFPLLSDTGSKVINALGIRNPKYPEGHFAYGIPHPTVLVVGANGIVKEKFLDENYKVRPETEVILDAISD